MLSTHMAFFLYPLSSADMKLNSSGESVLSPFLRYTGMWSSTKYSTWMYWSVLNANSDNLLVPIQLPNYRLCQWKNRRQNTLPIFKPIASLLIQKKLTN